MRRNARAHRAHRRRGGRVAARCACAAGRANATHRRPHQPDCGRSAIEGARRGLPAWLAASRLGGRSQPAHRLSLGWRQSRAVCASHATELIALAPDVMLAGGSEATSAFRQTTRTVPIVFVNVGDPVGAGYVDSLSRPSGNATGFLLFEYGISPKWLELLQEIAPGVTRVAIVRDATIAAESANSPAIRAVSSSFGMEISPIGVDDALEIEHAVSAFARGPVRRHDRNGDPVDGLPSRPDHQPGRLPRLPAVYPLRFFADGGGLICYGPDRVDHIVLPPAMSIASSRARSRPICRSRRRPSTSW